MEQNDPYGLIQSPDEIPFWRNHLLACFSSDSYNMIFVYSRLPLWWLVEDGAVLLMGSNWKNKTRFAGPNGSNVYRFGHKSLVSFVFSSFGCLILPS
jgi:hypothetical protein